VLGSSFTRFYLLFSTPILVRKGEAGFGTIMLASRAGSRQPFANSSARALPMPPTLQRQLNWPIVCRRKRAYSNRRSYPLGCVPRPRHAIHRTLSMSGPVSGFDWEAPCETPSAYEGSPPAARSGMASAIKPRVRCRDMLIDVPFRFAMEFRAYDTEGVERQPSPKMIRGVEAELTVPLITGRRDLRRRIAVRQPHQGLGSVRCVLTQVSTI